MGLESGGGGGPASAPGVFADPPGGGEGGENVYDAETKKRSSGY